MRASSLLVPLLVVACAGAGWGLRAQYTELVGAQAHLVDPGVSAKLRAQLATLQKQLAADQKRLEELKDPNAAIDPVDVDKIKRQKERREAKRQAAAAARSENSFAEMMKDPEKRRLIQLQQRGFFEEHNAAILKALNLPPEQTQKLHDLLLERDASMQDGYALAVEQGIDPKTDPKGFGALMGAVASDATKQIVAAVDDDDYKQYQKLAALQGQMAVASQLANSLSFTAAPLTDSQVTQLAAIFQQNPAARDPNAVAVLSTGGENRVTMRGGNVAAMLPSGGVQGVPALSDAAVTAAAGVLSPPQLDALKQLQQVQQSQLQLGKMVAPSLDPNSFQTVGSTPATSSSVARKK